MLKLLRVPRGSVRGKMLQLIRRVIILHDPFFIRAAAQVGRNPLRTTLAGYPGSNQSLPATRSSDRLLKLGRKSAHRATDLSSQTKAINQSRHKNHLRKGGATENPRLQMLSILSFQAPDFSKRASGSHVFPLLNQLILMQGSPLDHLSKLTGREFSCHDSEI